MQIPASSLGPKEVNKRFLLSTIKSTDQHNRWKAEQAASLAERRGKSPRGRGELRSRRDRAHRERRRSSSRDRWVRGHRSRSPSPRKRRRVDERGTSKDRASQESTDDQDVVEERQKEREFWAQQKAAVMAKRARAQEREAARLRGEPMLFTSSSEESDGESDREEGEVKSGVVAGEDVTEGVLKRAKALRKTKKKRKKKEKKKKKKEKKKEKRLRHIE